MKGTTIAFAALGLIDIGMIALNRAANRHGRKLAEAECDINDAILNKRTGADAEAEINHVDDIRVLREQKEVDAKAAEDIFNAKPQTIKIAEFLKDHKVPKAVVPMFGVVSMAPVGYLSYRWLKFLGQIMRAM